MCVHKMVRKIRLAPDIVSQSLAFMLLALILPINGNQLSIHSGLFQKSVKGNKSAVKYTGWRKKMFPLFDLL